MNRRSWVPSVPLYDREWHQMLTESAEEEFAELEDMWASKGLYPGWLRIPAHLGTPSRVSSNPTAPGRV